MNKINAFFGLILLIVLSSCKKDQPPVPMYNCPVSQEALDLAYFQPGTYWIYEDSATGKMDSSYVTWARNMPNVITGTPAQQTGFGGYFGEMVCRVTSSYFGLQKDYGPFINPYTYQPQIQRERDHLNDTTYISMTGARFFKTPYSVDYFGDSDPSVSVEVDPPLFHQLKNNKSGFKVKQISGYFFS